MRVSPSSIIPPFRLVPTRCRQWCVTLADRALRLSRRRSLHLCSDPGAYRHQSSCTEQPAGRFSTRRRDCLPVLGRALCSVGIAPSLFTSRPTVRASVSPSILSCATIKEHSYGATRQISLAGEHFSAVLCPFRSPTSG